MPLYSFYCSIAQVQSGTDIVSLSTAAESGSKRAGTALGRRRKNFIAPRKRRRFPEHGRHRTVLVFAELDGVLHRSVVELAAETIEHFQLNPDGRRFRGSFARTNYLQRFELLPLLLEDHDHVGGGTGTQRKKYKLHRAGRFVRRTVGIDGNRVPGRARGHEFFFSNPFHGCSLHAASPRKHSRTGNLKRAV